MTDTQGLMYFLDIYVRSRSMQQLQYSAPKGAAVDHEVSWIGNSSSVCNGRANGTFYPLPRAFDDLDYVW